MTLDDPFVTYRYAANIAGGNGAVYNVGETVLSTTALGYALLLVPAPGPVLGNALSIVGMAALSAAIYELGRRNGQAFVGFGAAIVAVTSPLLVSTFGLETCLFLAAVAWGAVTRGGLAGALLGGATLLRPDGALAMAVLSRGNRRAFLVYGAIVVPWVAALTLYYGSPIPTTLAAKAAQATIAGWPGYYDGLLRLLAARFETSPLAWAAIPLVVAGLVALPSHRWAWPLVGWGVAQAIAYITLGVASYDWYYAPLVPGAAIVLALGAASIQPRAIALGLVVAVVAGQLAGLQMIRRNAPEPRAVAYERAGRWLEANTTPGDRVAVMEVGIIGYYAQRPMVDLLGLIRPETIEALRRQDFFWTIADAEPESVVLIGRNPLWFQFAQPDHWFHQLYAPVHQIEQAGFWGSPLTIFRRTAPKRLEPPDADMRLDRAYGDSIVLERVEFDRVSPRAGEAITVELFWRATQQIDRDFAAYVHLLNAEPKVVAQHDTPVTTTRWPLGRTIQYYHPIVAPAAGTYDVEIGLYHPEEPLKRLSPDQPGPVTRLNIRPGT